MACFPPMATRLRAQHPTPPSSSTDAGQTVEHQFHPKQAHPGAETPQEHLHLKVRPTAQALQTHFLSSFRPGAQDHFHLSVQASHAPKCHFGSLPHLEQQQAQPCAHPHLQRKEVYTLPLPLLLPLPLSLLLLCPQALPPLRLLILLPLPLPLRVPVPLLLPLLLPFLLAFLLPMPLV